MPERRYRVLLVCSHPVQYGPAMLRQMAQHPELEILVAYWSLQGARSGIDPGFGVEVRWDTPLLEGYPWLELSEKASSRGLRRVAAILNPRLWNLVKNGGFDAVEVFTGYAHASFWMTAAAAKFYRKALLFGTDAHEIRPADNRAWKLRLKRWVWPVIFRLADVVLAPSSGSVALMRSLGIPSDRIVMTPYVVDNDWWRRRAEALDRAALRRSWGVPEDAPVVLFSAKLQNWKRPLDLLRAFAKADVPGAYLVYAGEGPLRSRIEKEQKLLGVAERVRLLGFANQSELPSIYGASDLLVLPSDYEPFGVVVNEAMLCGCAVGVSDRVGAGYDLVTPGQNGFRFRSGDVSALADTLREILQDRARLEQMGKAAQKRMETWSPRESVQGHLNAVATACAFKQRARACRS